MKALRHAPAAESAVAPSGRRNAEPEKQLCILVVDDEEMVRRVCAPVIESLGHQPLLAASAAEALEAVERQPVDLVLTDLRMPGMSGIELLQRLKAGNPEIEVAVMTVYASIASAVHAIKLGAADYVTKPFSTEDLQRAVQRLVETRRLKEENRYLRDRLRSPHGFRDLAGQSQPMQKVFRLIRRVSATRIPVLILGESGTGKELVARSVHEAGPWRDHPFVPVDCASLTPTLIESELFGYVRGAFTGAVRSKEGLLGAAGEGTLFLDEVAELPLDLQSRLLRAIQEKEFRPVGGTKGMTFRAHILAATNRDLEAAVRQGSFRSDLYFRLNVVAITLPPLRDRKADIPLLAEQILRRLAAVHSKGHRSLSWAISSEAMDLLLAYDWPGNVRELENCLERAVTLGSGPLIGPKDLPSSLHAPPLPRDGRFPESVIPLEEMERQAILRALSRAGGDKILAARWLGIGKTTLYRKLRGYQQKH